VFKKADTLVHRNEFIVCLKHRSVFWRNPNKSFTVSRGKTPDKLRIQGFDEVFRNFCCARNNVDRRGIGDRDFLEAKWRDLLQVQSVPLQ
tara:strand:+ start:202 stop:471 length:270 start_codon:yes stop_codon:yes gene_type:complete